MRNLLKRLSFTPGAFRRAAIGWAAVIGVGLAFSVALTGCAPAASNDPVVAMRVDGVPVSLSAYQQMLALWTANNALNTDANASAVGWTSPDDRSLLLSGRQQTVQFFASTLSLKEKLDQAHIAVTQNDINVATKAMNSEIASVRDSLKQEPGNARLRQEVDALTPDVVKWLAEQQAYQTVFLNKGQIPTAHIRVILVNTQADANSILAQLKAGADFATLAKAHSTDTQTAANGGDVSQPIYAGQIGIDFDQLVFLSKQRAPFSLQLQGSGYGIFEVVSVANGKLSAVSDTSTAQQYLNGWLTDVVAKQITVDNYLGS